MFTNKFLQILCVLRKAIDYLASGVVLITSIVIGCTLMAGVVVRYVVSSSLSWSAELPMILFPWLVMGGIVMAASRQEHLGVDYLVRKLSPGVERSIAIAMQLLIATTMVMLATQSQSILQFLQYQTTPVLGWSATWAFYSLPCGAIGILILSLIRVIELFRPHGAATSTGAQGGCSGETLS